MSRTGNKLYHVRMNAEYDIVIVGGGLVGMSLAIALDASHWRVLQIEAQSPHAFAESWDERHFALGNAAIERLTEMRVWSKALGQSPIRSVHVSRAGAFGRVLLSADEMGMPAFGATVPARTLVAALEERLSACQRMQRLRPARLERATALGEYIELELRSESGVRTIRCKLLVAADGSDSPIREECGIPVQREDYAQTAVVCSAQTEHAHGGRAFERFTDDGPFALLPLSDNRLGVVCTLPTEFAFEALQFDDQQYLQLLQTRFGYRLGKFTRVGRRQTWPLRLAVAERVTDQRVVLIGNAAQTIHPIGAQGFNLGLRDASGLAEVLRHAGTDAGAQEVLRAYEESRKQDRNHTIGMSDGLVRATTPSGLIPTALRGLGMAMIDRVPALSRRLAQSSMGYRRRIP